MKWERPNPIREGAAGSQSLVKCKFSAVGCDLQVRWYVRVLVLVLFNLARG